MSVDWEPPQTQPNDISIAGEISIYVCLQTLGIWNFGIMQTSVYFLISCTLESGRMLFVLSSICRNKTFKVQLNLKFMTKTIMYLSILCIKKFPLGVGLLWLIDLFFHIINYIIISLVQQGHGRSIAAWYKIIRQKKAIRLTSARVGKSGIFEKLIMGNLWIYFAKNAFELKVQ